MLVTIAIGLLFFSCTFVIGYWVKAVLARGVNSSTNGIDLFQNVLLSFAFITAFLSIWSFFLPVNFYALVPVIIFCIITRKYSSHDLQELIRKLKQVLTTRFAVMSVTILIVVVAYALMPPLHGDSPGYHFHSIRWNEEYKIIPGLANLHGRFGFNSSFFVTSAAFAFTKIVGQPVYAVNIVFVLSFYVWLLYKAFNYRDGVWSVVFIIAALSLFRELLYGTSSPTPDTIATIIAVYVFITLS